MTNAAHQPTSRRAARRARRAGAAVVSATRTRHRAFSRAAVLAALGTMTIVGPLTATSQAAPETAPTAAAATGVVATLAQGAADLPEATALDADPAATTRAATTASRDHLRRALDCPVQSDANGALPAVMGGEEVAPALVMPVAEGTYRLTSAYGPRTYPFPGMHEGTDFAGAQGTPLYAVADGTVIYSGGGRDGRSGQIVIIRAEVDGATYDFWYGHMYTNGVYVTEGQQVTAGQHIADIGNNGNSTGPHLHFEVHDANNNTTDPHAFLTNHGAQGAQNATRCA